MKPRLRRFWRVLPSSLHSCDLDITGFTYGKDAEPAVCLLIFVAGVDSDDTGLSATTARGACDGQKGGYGI
jgi:hypothetical protein